MSKQIKQFEEKKDARKKGFLKNEFHDLSFNKHLIKKMKLHLANYYSIELI